MTLLQYLVQNHNLDEKKAFSIIKQQLVLINNVPEILPNTKININDNIRIKSKKIWVSRGAYKLLEAINFFNIDFKNKIVLDIGSSTGGFTEVALNYGAKKVYALDVGTNQLEYKIRTNPKCVSMENTNLKTIKQNMFEDKIDIVLSDVSFISLKEVFKVIGQFTDELSIMALIKPQFEAFSSEVEERGYVAKSKHKTIINRVLQYAENYDISKIDIHESPILGNKSKNIEYLCYLKKGV